MHLPSGQPLGGSHLSRELQEYGIWSGGDIPSSCFPVYLVGQVGEIQLQVLK